MATSKTATTSAIDGNAHQIDRITAEAERLGKPITIIVDVVHVLDYVWGAAWCLCPKGDLEESLVITGPPTPTSPRGCGP